MLALVIAGAVWWLRRGDWLVPAAAAASSRSGCSRTARSPRTSPAKALVIVAPLLSCSPSGRWSSARAGRRAASLPWRLAAGAARAGARAADRRLELGLPCASPGRSARTTCRAARAAAALVARPDALPRQRRLHPLGARRRARQRAGHRLPRLSTRPEKPWEYGQPFDFDSLDAPSSTTFKWVITPRDAAGSEPPEQLQLVRSTPSFQLWRRDGTLEPRQLLAEGEAAGGAARLLQTTGAATGAGRRRGNRAGSHQERGGRARRRG